MSPSGVAVKDKMGLACQVAVKDNLTRQSEILYDSACGVRRTTLSTIACQRQNGSRRDLSID